MKIILNGSQIVVCVFGFMLGTSAHAVWINEFHYDNDGGDVGEFVEVAGLAGTDLTGYELLLYNGSNGKLYGTLALNGLIDNELNGYGALAFDAAGLQNGAPDGIALWNGTAIVQFLSYEGSFVAVDGHAASMTSSDVGVTELGTTPVGRSLQLTGSGTSYSDFLWNSPALGSGGSINAGQVFPAQTTSVPDGGSSLILMSLAFGALGFASCRRIRAQG